MQKNIDGIKKIKTITKRSNAAKSQVLSVDGVKIISRSRVISTTKLKTVKKQIIEKPEAAPSWKSWAFVVSNLKTVYDRRNLSFAVLTLSFVLVFISGMWVALNTTHSQADEQSQVLGESVTAPSGNVAIDLPPSNNSISNDVLFNTPLQQLKDYLTNTAQPDIIEKRKNQLTTFLQQMHSPLAPSAEIIAVQPHWQLILAIAFAESTLGKNCKDNNCSNIGVGPSSPLWRKYDSYQGWVVDFNRLLDKKYNNWTLQEMCGIYVKPCNPNWLLATQQILNELKDQDIE